MNKILNGYHDLDINYNEKYNLNKIELRNLGIFTFQKFGSIQVYIVKIKFF